MKKNFWRRFAICALMISLLITSFSGCIEEDNGNSVGNVGENDVTTEDPNVTEGDVTTSGSAEEDVVASFRGLKVLSVESDAGDVLTIETIEYDTMEQHVMITLKNNSSTVHTYEKHFTITNPDGSQKTDWVNNQSYPIRENKSAVVEINPQYWGAKNISGTYKIEHHVMEYGTLNKYTFIYTLRFTPCEPNETDKAPSDVRLSPTTSGGKEKVCVMSASKGKELIVPRVYEGMDIKGIHTFAFRDSEYENAILKDNIQFVEGKAFSGSSKLKSISFGSGLSEIGSEAFKGCSSLTDIYYSGTKAKWETIRKGNDWDNGTPNYTIHCTDGDIVKGS